MSFQWIGLFAWPFLIHSDEEVTTPSVGPTRFASTAVRNGPNPQRSRAVSN